MPNLTRSAPARSDILHTWTVTDSLELYNVPQWGQGFFGINAAGNVVVRPQGSTGPAVDLKELVDELRQRGIGMPMLLRFSDILRTRIEQMNAAFARAIAEHEFAGSYMGVYPIKVNQQRHVVEEIVQFGQPYKFGLEAGSKPELLAVLALSESNEPLIICNGYKDADYVDIALWGTKLGKTLILVVEEFRELELILSDGSNPQFLKAFQFAVERAYGRPVQAVDSESHVTVWLEGGIGDLTKDDEAEEDRL